MGHEQIISFIKANGPVLPAKVAKAINTNLLFASAQMSELVDDKKLKLSNLKVGGSPVYFLSGQEGKLQDFAENLNEKDKRAYDFLKQNKIVKDSDLEPLMRVGMRAIKDFAIPLQVTFDNEKLLFWKWYMTDPKEAESIIGNFLKGKNEKLEEEKREQERLAAEKAALEKQEKEKLLQEQKKKEEAEKKALEEKRKKELEKIRAEGEKRLQEERKKIEAEKNKIEEEKRKLNEQKQLDEERKRLEQTQLQKEKDLLREKQEQLSKESVKVIKDEFFDQLTGFFKEKKIEIDKYEIVRKKAEIDFILRLPSVVGNLHYYCKAKNKKKISDGDLSSAFVQGQLKKLPVLMLVTGELTKKAEELLNTEFKTSLVVKKI